MAISLQRVIRSTACFVLGWGFLKRRIERRYFRFEQIQNGGRRHVGKISSGDISATGRPIHFMFCSMVGFSGTADLMALFSIRTNSRCEDGEGRGGVKSNNSRPTVADLQFDVDECVA